MTGVHHVTPNSGKAPAIRPFGLYRFDIFCADPGYGSWRSSIAGPILWGFGFTFTTLAYVRNVPAVMPRPSRT